MTDINNKKSMPPNKNFRASISLLDSSVFDTSNGDKLVQFIRNKRGIRNAQPIFCDPSAENTKRDSFPIEIEAIKTTRKESDKNNKDVANVHQPPLGTNDAQNTLINQSQLPISSRRSPSAARVPLKRLSCNLGRRILLKEFEKTQLDGQLFLPEAASTPLSQNAQCDEYGSIVSNIGQCADGTITNTSTLKPIHRPCNNAETIKQPKTITDSLICQTAKPQLVEADSNCKKQTQTQMYNESIEVDDDNNKDEHQVDRHLTNNKASRIIQDDDLQIDDGDLQIDETLMSSHDIAQSLLEISHHDQPAQNDVPPSKITSSNNITHPEISQRNSIIRETNQQLASSENGITSILNTTRNLKPAQSHLISPSLDNRTSEMVRTQSSKSARFSHTSASLKNRRTSKINTAKNSQATRSHPPTSLPKENSISDGFEPIIEATKKSIDKSTSIFLALMTPTQQKQNIQEPSQDISIPATQSQPLQNTYPQSPQVLISIHANCNKNQLEKPGNTVASLPAAAKSQRPPQKVQSDRNSDVILITNDESLAQSKKLVPSRKKQRSKRFQRNIEPLMTSDGDISDDESIGVDVHNHVPQIAKQKMSSFKYNQSGVMDLRVASRRSNNQTKSIKSKNNNDTEKRDKSNYPLRQTISSEQLNSEKISEIDNFLTDVSQLPSRKPINNQTTMRSFSSPVVNHNLMHNVPARISELMNNSSSSWDSLDNFDENIIEPLTGCSNKHGVIYDMSPKSGMRWVDSMIKNSVTSEVNRKTIAAAKRGNRVISRNADPATLTYKDVELAMQQTLKNKSSTNNRRKLYSKGFSDNEYSSEASPEKLYDSRRANSTLKSFSITNTASKIFRNRTTKGKKHRSSTKIQTIHNVLSDWRQTHSEYDQPDRSNQKNAVIIEDKEPLFKVPQNPVPHSKKIALNKSLAINKTVESNAKLFTAHKRTNDGQRSNSSSNSEDDSYNSHHSKAIYSKKPTQRSQKNYDKTVHQSDKSLPSSPKKVRNSSYKNQQNFETTDSDISDIRPKTKSKQDSNQIKLITEPPVDPDVTDQTNNKSNRSQRSKNKSNNKVSPENVSEQNNNKFDSVLNDRPSDINMRMDTPVQTTNQKSSTRKPPTNKKPSALERGSTRKKESITEIQQEEIQETEIIESHQSKQDESVTPSIKRGGKKKIEDDNIKRRSKRHKLKRKGDESMKISKKQKPPTEITTTGAGLRRSNRTHRPPIAYWTNRREMDITHISYIDPQPSERTKSVHASKKGKKKREQNLESIDERPPNPNKLRQVTTTEKQKQQHERHLNPTDERPPDTNESRHLADGLFDALKEVSIRQTIPNTIDGEGQSTSSQAHNYSAAITQNVPSTSKRGYRLESVTDSGHATTDSNNEQNPSEEEDVILHWLRNLVQPKTITSNPVLVKIFSSSNVRIASANNLIFQDFGGVHYAYYNKISPNDENYGYMRFFPNSTKKMSKTKYFELKFLCLRGILHLSAGKESSSLRDGDFATVPKGTRYALANKSQEVAILFFIKS